MAKQLAAVLAAVRTKATQTGRLARSGTLPTPKTLDGQMLRDAAVSLSRRLEQIAADPQATPREKHADSKRALADSRRISERIRAKSASVVASVDEIARRIGAKVGAYENSLSPIAIKRIEARMRGIDRADVPALVERALVNHDSELLLVCSLVAPDMTAPRRALSCLHAPKELEQFQREARDAIELEASARAWQQGIDDLDAVSEPWSIEHQTTGNDLFMIENEGAASVADLEVVIPYAWSPDLRQVAGNPAAPIATDTGAGTPAQVVGGAA